VQATPLSRRRQRRSVCLRPDRTILPSGRSDSPCLASRPFPVSCRSALFLGAAERWRPWLVFDLVLRSLPRLVLGGSLLLDQPVGEVVLVDVAHVLHGLAADLLRGNELDIVEPYIGIKSALFCLLAKLLNSPRPRVVGGKGKQPFVKRVH